MTVWIVFSFFGPAVWAAPTSYIQEHKQTINDDRLPPDFWSAIAQKRLLLVGETHGTNEQPQWMARIAREVSSAQNEIAIGLEWPKNIEVDVQRYIDSGDESILANLDFFKDPNYHVGRGSQAMVALLRELRKFTHVSVFCLDIEPGQSMSDRDTQMAKNVLEYIDGHPQTLVITYTGNVHARLTNGYPGSEKAINMGAEILRLGRDHLSFSNVTNLMLRYSQGKQYRCRMVGDQFRCGVVEISKLNDSYTQADDGRPYFLGEPSLYEGYQLGLFSRVLTASLPFVAHK